MMSPREAFRYGFIKGQQGFLPSNITFAEVKSVKALSELKGASVLPENDSVGPQRNVRIVAVRPRRVREGKSN